jgi:hypothetical protein
VNFPDNFDSTELARFVMRKLHPKRFKAYFIVRVVVVMSLIGSSVADAHRSANFTEGR